MDREVTLVDVFARHPDWYRRYVREVGHRDPDLDAAVRDERAAAKRERSRRNRNAWQRKNRPSRAVDKTEDS